MSRVQLQEYALDTAVKGADYKMRYRLKQKGMGCFGSNHEILGVIRQETDEYSEAIHLKKSDQEKIEELLDIAVAALIGIASIESGGLDW